MGTAQYEYAAKNLNYFLTGPSKCEIAGSRGSFYRHRIRLQHPWLAPLVRFPSVLHMQQLIITKWSYDIELNM